MTSLHSSSIVRSFAPAPVGTRVRLLTMISFGVVTVMIAVVGIVVGTDPKSEDALIAVLAVAASLPVVLLIWLSSRIRAYDIVDGVFRVTGLWRGRTFPLAGLETAREDRRALEGARKVIGNDGLGSIHGRFRSRKLGAFRVYVTDPERAVVLRWPDRCVVVSPEKPALFIDALLAARERKQAR